MHASDIVLGAGIACILVGGYMYPDAASTILPEHEGQLSNRGAFWHTDWFIPAAHRQIRRARGVQLAGVGLIAVLVVIGWLS
jgi:hypothetical protein